jgi:uncharacterized protein (DUF433 family)
MFGFDRVSADPKILGGRACIRGMRISVSLIVNLVANGMTVAEILEEYPDLEEEDVRQALHYAAWTMDDIVYIPVEKST